MAICYIGLYLALIAIGMPKFAANGVAFFLAILFQYAAQAAFTFQRPLGQKTQMVRFAVMVSLGFVTSAIITGPVAVALGLPDWQAALAVTILLPVQNFFLMKLWVFAAPPSSQTDILT